MTVSARARATSRCIITGVADACGVQATDAVVQGVPQIGVEGRFAPCGLLCVRKLLPTKDGSASMHRRRRAISMPEGSVHWPCAIISAAWD